MEPPDGGGSGPPRPAGEPHGVAGDGEPLSALSGAEAAAGEGASGAAGAAAEAGPVPVLRQRSLRAVYVLNDTPKGGSGARSPEAGALMCLVRACEAEGAQLATVNFGELDFGETAVLDAFYDAGE